MIVDLMETAPASMWPKLNDLRCQAEYHYALLEDMATEYGRLHRYYTERV
jgi:hypothetical protein